VCITEEDEIRSTVKDLENQRVVRADAERTRGSENLDKDTIELILTKYCKNNNIKYKQGLNEVLAPFMYMM
jgi:RNase H-fold protein (predicted Holliday junction resolvase)